MNRRGTKAGYLYDLLVGRSFDGDITIEPYLITLGPDAVPHTTFRHAGNEFLYMLSGTMVYRHGQRSYTLRAGDALYFDASARHGPEEFTRTPISYLSLVTYPRR
jgi:mannose-6-phosphate isomerase-like protein (cupin superfamily)